MNRANIDDNLVKQLDLINYWEPFQRAQPSLKVGIRAIVNDLLLKRKIIRESQSEIDSVELTNFDKPIVLSYNTINQKSALEGLCSGINGAFNLISEVEEFKPEQILSDEYTYSQAFHYKFQLIKWFYQFKGHDKKVFESRFYNFYSQLGRFRHYYLSFLASKQNVRCYIASNDHSGLSQIGFVAARRAGIPTIYIQHASISDRFPPLRTTYAFLDGENAKANYLAAGKTITKIELTGPMKYDPYLNHPKLNIPGSLIGICLGLAHCDIDENVALCHKLAEANLPFCIRFHPLMDSELKAPFQVNGWEFSEPSNESAPDFILRCNSIVSPDSNIHLEAIILKRRGVYMAPKLETLDYYGFVKNGVIESAVHNADEVLERLKSDFDIEQFRINARHYHAGLYTEWEGKSTERIVQRVREIAGI